MEVTIVTKVTSLHMHIVYIYVQIHLMQYYLACNGAVLVAGIGIIHLHRARNGRGICCT